MKQYGQSGPLASAREQSPWQLVEMLLSGALVKIAQARQALAQGDVGGRGAATSRAIDIVGYLDGILDRSAGGEMGERLALLYDYVIRLLLKANTRRDDAAFAEAAQLLAEVKQAWDALPQQDAQVAA